MRRFRVSSYESERRLVLQPYWILLGITLLFLQQLGYLKAKSSGTDWPPLLLVIAPLLLVTVILYASTVSIQGNLSVTSIMALLLAWGSLYGLLSGLSPAEPETHFWSVAASVAIAAQPPGFKSARAAVVAVSLVGLLSSAVLLALVPQSDFGATNRLLERIGLSAARTSLSFGDYVALGHFSLLCIAAAILTTSVTLRIIIGGSGFALVLLGDSRSVWLAAGVLVGIELLRVARRNQGSIPYAGIGVVALVAGLATVSLVGWDDSSRFSYWQRAFEALAEGPDHAGWVALLLGGVGPQMEPGVAWTEHLHNVFATAMFQVGLLGVGIFIVLLAIALFRDGVGERFPGLLAALIVLSLFESPPIFTRVGVETWTWLTAIALSSGGRVSERSCALLKHRLVGR